MNADRRKRLDRIKEVIEQAKADLDEVRDEERDAFDNMPEGLQASDMGNSIEEAADALDEASDDLDSVLASIGTARGDG